MLQRLYDVLDDSNLQCSYKEKLEVLETVKKIFKIVFFARRNGILALEDVAAEQEDMFFKSCLLLLVEGATPEELEEYASIWMLADNAEGKHLLEMAVIADGVVQIQKGKNPKMIFHRLGAWFGSKFAENFESVLQEIKIWQD